MQMEFAFKKIYGSPVYCSREEGLGDWGPRPRPRLANTVVAAPINQETLDNIPSPRKVGRQ